MNANNPAGEKFARRYHGEGARDYEVVRQDAKWRREEEIFDELYERVRPRSVLDCPIGTGRFLDRYVRDGVSVLGVDLSSDMLAEAAKKVPPGANVRLEKGDALAPNLAALCRDHDLIVCTRFLYALREDQFPVLFANFSRTGARHLLLGVRMWPETSGPLRRISSRFWNTAKKRPRWPFGRARRFVAKEKRLLELLRKARWHEVDRREIRENRDAFSRYFLLLKNEDA
jgi:SAM-dependent methyltransferase